MARFGDKVVCESAAAKGKMGKLLHDKELVMSKRPFLNMCFCLWLILPLAVCGVGASAPTVAAFYRPSLHVGQPAGQPIGNHAPFKPLPAHK